MAQLLEPRPRQVSRLWITEVVVVSGFLHAFAARPAQSRVSMIDSGWPAIGTCKQAERGGIL
jgi:hypothetical protein